MPVKPDKLKSLFQANLRARRLELGMTQKDLAEKLDAHQPYVADLENGMRHPTLETLAKLSEALRVPPDFFLATAHVQKISA